jgi:hypothetical protein
MSLHLKKVVDYTGLISGLIAVVGVVVGLLRKDPSAFYTLVALGAVGLAAWAVYASYPPAVLRVVICVVVLTGLAAAALLGQSFLRSGEPTQYVDPLTIHWYGFGQRLESGAWHEFRVQDGVIMYDGDQFRIAFTPNADCHVYILCFNADGTVHQLFPHPAIRQGSFCRRGQEYQVPDGLNWFALKPPSGVESLFLIASYNPQMELAALLGDALGKPMLKGVRQAVEEQIGQIELQNNPDNKGAIWTRSGTVVRNVQIQPDKKVTSCHLESGEEVQRSMEILHGIVSLVHKIEITHVDRGVH